jgi:membrane protease YdiL (CAAX protease family)
VYEAERDRLRRDLGWFGELALAPPGTPDETARAAALRPAKRTAWALLAGVSLVLLLGAVGCAGLTALLVLLLLGRLRGGLVCGQTAGSVYAETFAVWLALFGVLGLLSERIPLPSSKLLLNGAAALLSLAALLWPVWRGLSWQQVRQDIGWVRGRRGWREPVYGVVCYVAWLPVVLLAMLLVVGLYLLQARYGGDPADSFAPTKSPAHPVALDIGKGGWWSILQVFVVAAVVAPLVEETMFRGVLYRHLREATGRWRPVCSVLISGAITSFLFAVIHPQGLIAVPLLMALAGGFTIAREWRGTLAPVMVAHGLNNAAAMVFAILVLGG